MLTSRLFQTTPGLLAASLFAAALAAMPATVRAAPCSEMSAEQYRLYKDYQQALSDPRVQKMSEAKRLPAIARDRKESEKKLREAVAAGDAQGAGIEKRCEKEVRTELAASSLKGKIGEVTVDATDGHVVTYVQWRNDDGSKIEEEAATAALLAARAAPITSTVALWAKDASGRKVFEAKIGADAAARFSQERIAMFARARYIKVFEGVKNAYTGTPPTD